MARHSWETDAVVPRKSGGSRVQRVFFGLLAIGVATFIAAYYVPLLRAHQALSRLSNESVAKADGLEKKVQKLEKDLSAASSERDRLTQAEQSRASSSRDSKDRLATISSDLTTALKKPSGKGLVTIGAGQDAVRIAIRPDVLFPGDKPELNPMGGGLLCEVSRAAGSRRMEISLNTRSLTATPDIAWSSAAEAAGRVATHLEQKCGRKALTAINVRAETGENAPRDVELLVYP
jgi:chemotaxis protein MotB